MLWLAALATPAPAQSQLEWQTDIETAQQQAANENKLVMLHFAAQWCKPCKELERFVFANPIAVRAINTHVVPVRIDIDLQPGIAEQYGVSSVPNDVIITPAGHVVAGQPSPQTSDGYTRMISDARVRSDQLTARSATPETGMQQTELDARHHPRSARVENRFVRQPPAAKSQVAGIGDGGSFQPTAPQLPEVRPPQFPSLVSATAPLKPHTGQRSSSLTPGGGPFAAPAPPATQSGPLRIENRFVANLPGPEGANSLTANPSPGDSGEITDQVRFPISEHASRFGKAVPPAATPRESPTTPMVVTNQFMPDAGGTTGNPSPDQPRRIVNSFATGVPADPVALKPLDNHNVLLASEEPAINPIRNPHFGRADMDHQAAVGETPLPPLGIDGYCGVSLMEEQKWIRGKHEFGCVHRGKLYLFATQEHLDRFMMTPDIFSPVLGGADPVAWHGDGQLVDGARQFGVFYGDEGEPTVIVLFANRKNRDTFEADPSTYLQSVRQAMMRLDDGSMLR